MFRPPSGSAPLIDTSMLEEVFKKVKIFEKGDFGPDVIKTLATTLSEAYNKHKSETSDPGNSKNSEETTNLIRNEQTNSLMEDNQPLKLARECHSSNPKLNSGGAENYPHRSLNEIVSSHHHSEPLISRGK